MASNSGIEVIESINPLLSNAGENQTTSECSTSASDKRRIQKEAGSLRCTSCVKGFVSILVALCFTVALTAGQISMFHLSMTLGVLVNASKSGNFTSSDLDDFTETMISPERIKATKVFSIIVLALITPYLWTFIQGSLKFCFGRKFSKPSRRMVISGVVGALCEAGGVSLFAIKVFPMYHGVGSSLLLCSILLGGTLSQLTSYCSGHCRTGSKNQPNANQPAQRPNDALAQEPTDKAADQESSQSGPCSEESKPVCKYILITFITVLQLGGIGCVMWWIIETFDTSRWWFPLLALFFLLVGWFPILAKLTVEFKVEKEETIGNCFKKSNAAWEMSLISNFMKVILTVSISCVLYLTKLDDKGFTWDNRSKFWEELKLSFEWTWGTEEIAFIILIVTCFVAHEIGLFLCKISTSMPLFLFPGYFSNLVIIGILWHNVSCMYLLKESLNVCTDTLEPLWAVIVSTCCLSKAALLSIVLSYSDRHIRYRKVGQIVWIPTFSTVAPGIWTVLNKRMGPLDEEKSASAEHHDKAQIFICTTMYRENKKEMTQLLNSFNDLNKSESSEGRYTIHIVFDDGCRGQSFTEFALQFLKLVKTVLGIPIKQILKTPYGMQFSHKDGRGTFKLPLTIHFKDISKVKAKKRWSQVMYMKLLLKDKPEGRSDESNRYILTTDADVKFTTQSLESLVDLMPRDKKVGAVTGRTHPAGHGPFVWYQIFEYAIGHWFQKTAEHCFGSVLCAPGCFSLFRCEALSKVLTEYSSNVECGFDFLTKDMGEDRWLCTLMVQHGWTIEYSAASNNHTNCPDTFEELYKQRRRWVVSTIANMILLLKDYKKLRKSETNPLTMLFLLYQGIALASTFIAPCTVMLVVAGGLDFAWNVPVSVSLVLQLLACAAFIGVCLKKNMTSKHQVAAARCLSLLYSVIMAAVAVGTLKSVVGEYIRCGDSGLSNLMCWSASTYYITILIAIFVITAVLHGDFLAIFYGAFYFLCIPAAYVVLVIYSLCNITDRSWGTREQVQAKGIDKSLLTVLFEPVRDTIRWISNKLKHCCCTNTRQKNPSIEENATEQEDTGDSDEEVSNHEDVESWLRRTRSKHLIQYWTKLHENGYEDVCFLAHLNFDDLRNMGIRNVSHRKDLLKATAELPYIPVTSLEESTEKWLKDIGLGKYKPEQSISVSDILKITPEEMADKLNVTKLGHRARLKHAFHCICSKDEVNQRVFKAEIAEIPYHNLEHDLKFWTDLTKTYLEEEAGKESSWKRLKAELVKLRNYWLQLLIISNIIWLIFIASLASQSELTVMSVNYVGLILLAIFLLVLLIQFYAMISHRISTFIHILSGKSAYEGDFTSSCSRNSNKRKENSNSKDKSENSNNKKEPENVAK